MKFLGEKGQSFSVFQLLISAIVALVILVILLYILRIIPPIGTDDPITKISQAVNSANMTQSLMITTENVKLPAKYTLPREPIAKSATAGLSENQICLSQGDFKGTALFNGGAGENETKIDYTGSMEKSVRFSVLCYEGAKLPEKFGEGAVYEDLKKELAEECECVNDPELGKQVCCLVALRIPS
ncbi:MAG: hypothetical protein V1493_01885 [Candidatus Diapherotrites archaeon]